MTKCTSDTKEALRDHNKPHEAKCESHPEGSLTVPPRDNNILMIPKYKSYPIQVIKLLLERYCQGFSTSVKNVSIGQDTRPTRPVKVRWGNRSKNGCWPHSKERDNPFFDGRMGALHEGLPPYMSGKR